VGFDNFVTIFNSSDFSKIMRNTLLLNLLNLVLYFPAPIILALLLNEVRISWFKRLSQSLMYLPHFFSWVVLGGMIIDILSPNRGIVNNILERIIGEKIFFMASRFWWPLIFVLSSMWKEVGWGSIIYLAALSGIEMELYEAAVMDGAGRLKQMWHITLPSIRNTIVIMLILRMGGVLNVGMEQILMLENTAVAQISDVISTYTYRMGIQNMQYSTTTAIGIFQSIINTALLLCANWLSKKYAESSIF
jgi:putative aldouronate transport system permease protein